MILDALLAGICALFALDRFGAFLRPTPPEVIAARAEERRAKDLAEIAKHSTKVKA
jgi:hypothetical protein